MKLPTDLDFTGFKAHLEEQLKTQSPEALKAELGQSVVIDGRTYGVEWRETGVDLTLVLDEARSLTPEEERSMEEVQTLLSQLVLQPTVPTEPGPIPDRAPIDLSNAPPEMIQCLKGLSFNAQVMVKESWPVTPAVFLEDITDADSSCTPHPGDRGVSMDGVYITPSLLKASQDIFDSFVDYERYILEGCHPADRTVAEFQFMTTGKVFLQNRDTYDYGGAFSVSRRHDGWCQWPGFFK